MHGWLHDRRIRRRLLRYRYGLRVFQYVLCRYRHIQHIEMLFRELGYYDVGNNYYCVHCRERCRRQLRRRFRQ